MRQSTLKTIAVMMGSALALSACGKAEVKTGSLVQRFTMMDGAGVNFGVVELDPINGGSVMDAQGRLVGRIVPSGPTVLAAAVPAVQ